MKKIALIIITGLVMSTSSLSADDTKLCLYNGSEAAVESITFKYNKYMGPNNNIKIGTISPKDFLALGTKFCITQGEAKWSHSIYWKQKGQQYGSENNSKVSLSQGINRDYYIGPDNSIHEGKGY
jgi:hypothetical protein